MNKKTRKLRYCYIKETLDVSPSFYYSIHVCDTAYCDQNVNYDIHMDETVELNQY